MSLHKLGLALKLRQKLSQQWLIQVNATSEKRVYENIASFIIFIKRKK